MFKKNVLLFAVTLAFSGPAMGQNFEDELLIEAETAVADSEAAIQEAQEAQKIAAEERKKSDLEIRQAERELEKARRSEQQAKKDIAKAERARSRALEEADQAKESVSQMKQKIQEAKDQMADMENQLEEAKAQRKEALARKEKVQDLFSDVQRDLREMRRKLASVKKDELSAVKSLKRAETRLSDLQEKAKISYKNSDKDTANFLSSIRTHRKSLRKISKKLDDLEIEVETDKTFYDNQRRKKLASTLGKSNYSQAKVAKVMTTGCNIRNFPSLDSKVMAKTRRGSKMRVRKHSRSWYSIVYNGQKAFMGAGCF